MSVFDLFRGFFGVPGGRYREDDRRDPFFDAMTRDDDDDDDDEDFGYSGYEGGHHDPFDKALRFGFSFGPNGMRIQEPQLFGQVLREMEELFAGLGSWDRMPGIGQFGIPSIEAPPSQDNAEPGVGGAGGRSLRDFMLKSPDSSPPVAPGAPGDSRTAPFRSPFDHWSPFSKFNDIWRGGLKRREEEDTVWEDRDLDSRVSSEGLDQILTPAPTQPKTRSFFQSVTVTKVVAPDGTVEERRTVRDSQGNEETTVTRTGPGDSRGPQDLLGPIPPSLASPSTDQRDEGCIFAKFFGGFRG
ncbi:HCLS1-associated protein X-1 [Megalops cyprinoides]|uniref:HCLS1-associated protein X-1 n=1 Tax=Megalops cyprinoides TaxID=118141 RepID=UPI001865114A|nr:HCLS1-associated protein X-1 [Megalops cyprinoides]